MRLGLAAPLSGGPLEPVCYRQDGSIVRLIAAARLLAKSDIQIAKLEQTTLNGQWLDDDGRKLARDIVDGDVATIAKAVTAASEMLIGPPIVAPSKFIATGRNYMDHVREGQRIWAARGKTIVQSTFPTAFVKFASTIIAHGHPIQLPHDVENIDYEIELGVIIGRKAFRVSEDQALDYVAGYTICNDVGARTIQRAEMEHQIGIVMAKNLPGFSPLGPWLVTADEIPDPQNLDLRLTVNGELRQQANTSDMIFPVRQLVSYWSRIGLEPGDLIITGTPSGVALARPDPAPFYLKDGDVVSAAIQGIGELTNPVLNAKL